MGDATETFISGVFEPVGQGDTQAGDATGACISWSGPSLSRETSTGDATETFISGVFEPSVHRKH